jgi:hypothetical protein
MKHRLERRYGFGHLHFITCSCYQRKPLLGTERARNLFLRILLERGNEFVSAESRREAKRQDRRTRRKKDAPF